MKLNRYIAWALLAAGMHSMAYGFEARDLKVYNSADRVLLGGTLTTPSGKSPKAALVLATGSGSQNRDEEVMGHRPFKVIAEYLSDNGYAVLRLDDRGVGESTGDPAKSTSDDYAADLGAAISVLDSLLGHELPKGVLGHSEGGSVAVKMANRNPECRFIVTMGCPAWAGDSIIMSQSRALATSVIGRWDGEARQRRLMDIVKSDMSDALVASALYMELAADLGENAAIPQVQQQLSQTVAVMSAPSYRSIVKYNPADDIRSVNVPWLALNGEKDMQVLPGNITTIKELNPSADARVIAGHNHLMQHCNTGMVQEYRSITEDISDDVLRMILDWLDAIEHFCFLRIITTRKHFHPQVYVILPTNNFRPCNSSAWLTGGNSRACMACERAEGRIAAVWSGVSDFISARTSGGMAATGA